MVLQLRMISVFHYWCFSCKSHSFFPLQIILPMNSVGMGRGGSGV